MKINIYNCINNFFAKKVLLNKKNIKMIRALDIFLSLIFFAFLSPIFIISLLLSWIDTGSPLFFQMRLGKSCSRFLIVKFRTMNANTRSIETHLINYNSITFFGIFLRKYKLDELPQLWNVLIGDMSLVGPRPCLLNSKTLIRERKKRNVFKVKPGITGLAQISGINMKTPTLLAKTDLKMIKKFNIIYYFYYILVTFIIVLKKK